MHFNFFPIQPSIRKCSVLKRKKMVFGRARETSRSILRYLQPPLCPVLIFHFFSVRSSIREWTVLKRKKNDLIRAQGTARFRKSAPLQTAGRLAWSLRAQRFYMKFRKSPVALIVRATSLNLCKCIFPFNVTSLNYPNNSTILELLI